MTPQPGERTEPHLPGPDNRPEFRVALFGVAGKFERMLEIVARHALHNRYRYCLSVDRTARNFDIALVDMTVPGGPEVAGTLQRLLNGRPVIRMGRREDEARGRDELTHSGFASQVMQALNHFVEQHLAPRSRTGAANDSRDHGAPGTGKRVQKATDADDSTVRRPRALIVDDSATVRRQLAIALGQMGMESEAVCSSQEALELLSLRQYELVFADVVMPEQDGYQLTRQIKRDKSLKGTPVIILTSRSSPFDLAKGALAGCSSYLVKPVSLQSLRDTVSRQLQRGAVLRSRARELAGAGTPA